MEFYEVALTQRSIRRFKPDPVPDEVLWRILDTAIRAPSSGNSQPWIWLVVREEVKRRAISDEVRRRMEASGALGQMRQRAAQAQNPTDRRIWNNAADFRANMANAPVFVIPCLYADGVPAANQRTLNGGSSIYGAVQNLMLAARAEGLGTSLTGANDDIVRSVLHLPEGAVPACLIPLGYPDGERFGPTTRKPIDTVTYWDDWGAGKKRP